MEHIIRSIRKECFDHFIIFSQLQLAVRLRVDF